MAAVDAQATQNKQSITSEQIEVICAVEQSFWETGSLPTNERLNELTGINLETIKGYWRLDSFRNALLTRGVDLNPDKSRALLTVQQLNLANMLLNIHDKRSVREKIKELGISSQQYHAWMRLPAFRNYVSMRGEELFKSSDHEAYISLVEAVQGGDIRALQLFFEMRGIYNPKMQLDINIDVVLVRVVEVIARHVRDPIVLQNIANDLEVLELGTGPSGPVQMPVLDMAPVEELAPRPKSFEI